MSDEMIVLATVGLFLILAIVGIAHMKSPSKGGDAAAGIIEEIQKTFDPQVKEVRLARKKMAREKKLRKAGDDKDPGTAGHQRRTG